VRTCVIDGELIACDANGLVDFQLLRWSKRDDPAIYCVFDLIEFDGRDLQDEPIETRKAELARLLTAASRSHSSSTASTMTPARWCSSTRAGWAANREQTARLALRARPGSR
jgi:ATP-dependent DNA ligase